MYLPDLLIETRAERGQGSKQGRAQYVAGASGDRKANSAKSKVHVYSSIKDALSKGQYGDIFSTSQADRLYVVTKPDWGSKSRAHGNNKVAKGFTPGSSTPGASWEEIRKYSKRTKKKHGGQTSREVQEGIGSALQAAASGVAKAYKSKIGQAARTGVKRGAKGLARLTRDASKAGGKAAGKGIAKAYMAGREKIDQHQAKKSIRSKKLDAVGAKHGEEMSPKQATSFMKADKYTDSQSKFAAKSKRAARGRRWQERAKKLGKARDYMRKTFSEGINRYAID